MVSDINFGSLSTIGGKTVTSGSASGLDTESLINSLVEAKRLPAVTLEKDIETNKSKITALNELETILQKMKTSLDSLRNPTGFGSSATSAFGARSAFLTTNDGSTASNYVGVVATDGASIGNYSIKVNQLAQGDILQSASFASRDTDIVDTGLLVAGNFDLNGKTITVDDDETLNSLVSKINSVKSDTNTQASILKISDSDFRLVLTNSETGSAATVTIGGASTSTTGVFANKNLSNIQAAQQSQFAYIVGATETTIERSTNTIDDFIDNVTISLFSETPTDTEVSIDVDKDVQKVSTAIVDFVNAYNDFRVFNAKQNAVDDEGAPVDTAVLRNNTLLESTMSAIITKISASVNSPIQQSISDSSSVSRLGDVGISFDDFDGNPDEDIPVTTNILSVDVAALTTKLQSNFDDVQRLFEFSFSTDNTSFGILDTGNVSKTEELTLAVVESTSFAAVASIDGHQLSSAVNLNFDTTDERVTSGDTPGLTAILKGIDGTAFEGMELFYYTDGNTGVKSETFFTELNEGEKEYTIGVNDTAETSSITHIHGLELTTAIDLTYTKSDSGNSANITGPEDGPLGELQFLYVGQSTESINFSFERGFADDLFASVKDIVTGDSTSAIAKEIDSILTSNTRLEDSVERIDSQIAPYRQRLLAQFAALEAAISASESILQLLSAQNEARNNS